MGMRIQCAQCHNHPFDRWTMNDYYGFAAFFSQVGRKPGDDPRETVIFDRGDGEVKHPVTGAAMKPKFLGGEVSGNQGRKPPRSAGQMADFAGKSIFRAQHGEHRLGAFPRAGHYRPSR